MNGFQSLPIIFQLKMHSEVGPKAIRNWLRAAHTRAQELSYTDGTYMVQLFVTGSVESNVANWKEEWPANSMVFATEALKTLFEPFGSGFIDHIVKSRSRGS